MKFRLELLENVELNISHQSTPLGFAFDSTCLIRDKFPKINLHQNVAEKPLDKIRWRVESQFKTPCDLDSRQNRLPDGEFSLFARKKFRAGVILGTPGRRVVATKLLVLPIVAPLRPAGHRVSGTHYHNIEPPSPPSLFALVSVA